MGHEHFLDDVNDAVISAHIGPCDGRTIDLNAFLSRTGDTPQVLKPPRLLAGTLSPSQLHE